MEKLQEISVALSSGKICSGSNLRCWFYNPSLSDSGYAKRTVFHYGRDLIETETQKDIILLCLTCSRVAIITS